jgi:RNA polymerase sigma-70 factor, ECF subfamily
MQHRQPTLPARPVGDSLLTSMSDEILIALIAAQEKPAMRALFLRHKVRVFRFLLRLVGDAATADDLLSEVFIEVWRCASRFEARSKVSTWILAIARYKAASLRRRRRFEPLDDNAVALIEDADDDPETAVQKKNRAAVLGDCLKHLSPAHREVLDLIYYHEQSIPEVARIIGAPENTVKTRAFHARKRIAELMAARGIERAAL